MNDEPKHLDATKPGNVPVSHTSKPAIVTHQALPRDPMMREPAKPSDKFGVKDHKQVELKPPTVTAPDQAEVPESDPVDTELPKSVIENKQPIIDQEATKVSELIDKKTYNLPIQSSPTKIVLKSIVVVVVLAVIGATAFIVFAMNQ